MADVFVVYHEGDRVQFNEMDMKIYLLKSYDATVTSVLSNGILSVIRDDGVKGSGENGTYLILASACKLLARPAAFTGELQPIAASDQKKKGYTPDGFDANSHRDFMRNLGSSS
jgi:hypothetical protein